MINPEFFRNIGFIVICYLIGAIPFCNIIAKIHSDKDLRKIGDRNPGGWNLVFNVSKYWGFLGIILDVLKGFLSYFLVLRITGVEIVASGIFLWLFKGSSVYLIMMTLLLIIIIPKYINRSIRISHNFKFRKEKTVKDLFTPKIR